jgi:hypothetical protein
MFAWFSRDGVMDDHEGQAHTERRSLSLPVTCGVDGAPVHFDDVSHNREPEPQSGGVARQCGVRVSKADIRVEAYGTVDELYEVDQWTVHPSVRPYGPFLKYSWSDGREVYVSEATGEIVQQTTRGEQLGAWLGAIPHWLYFTPIRADPELWDALVTWSSGVGTVMAVFGLIVGVWLYSPVRKRYRFAWGRSGIPYAGQKRWHTMLGLAFGLFVCTWSLSGMLSMGPVSWLRSSVPLNLAAVLPGTAWSAGSFSEHPRDVLTRVADRLTVKELELAFVGGEPIYLAISHSKPLVGQ